MRFDWKNGLIWIEIEIIYAEQSIKIDNCIVDTGSVSTAIDIDLVNFDYQQPASIHRLVGIGGGTQEVLSQRVDEFRIDRQILKDIKIEFGDLHKELGINGFVGTDILSKFNLTMDFKKQILELYPDQS
jgi:hypothetical protein